MTLQGNFIADDFNIISHSYNLRICFRYIADIFTENHILLRWQFEFVLHFHD